MKRIHAGLAVAGLVGGALGIASALPAHASSLPVVSTCLPPSGQSVPAGTASGVVTVIGEQASSGTFSCSYKDTSTTAPQYGAATPNAFTITATHQGTDASGNPITVTDASASGAPATDVQAGMPQQRDVNGTLTGAKAGDTITVTVTLTCVPQDPTGQGCGGVGTIAVGSPS